MCGGLEEKMERVKNSVHAWPVSLKGVLKGAYGDVYEVGSQRKGTERELGSYLWVLLALLWAFQNSNDFLFCSLKHGTAHRNNDEADTEKCN